MNHLGYLKKILDGAEVEWKPLADLTLPTSNIKWRNVERTHRYIDLTSVSIETKKITETTEINAQNAPSRAQKLVEKDDVIFATTRPLQQRYCLIENEYSGEVASTGFCVLRAKKGEVLPKWILHCISSTEFKTHVEEYQSGAAYPAISDANVKAFSIPVPCPENPQKSLVIQAQIVRVLDAFAALTMELTTELTAELTARKKQYNYYRDQLLTEKYASSQETTLGDILDMRAGKHIKANDISDSQTVDHKYNCYGGNGSRGYVKDYSHDGKFVLIGRQGALCGNVKRTNEKFYATEHAVVCTPMAGVNIDWAFYMLTFMDLNQYKSKSAQPGLAVGKIAQLPITIPPPEEQARIVSILDKFDTLTNSISEGLPREIELRQTQYEFYRDVLLNFPTHGKAAA